MWRFSYKFFLLIVIFRSYNWHFIFSWFELWFVVFYALPRINEIFWTLEIWNENLKHLKLKYTWYQTMVTIGENEENFIWKNNIRPHKWTGPAQPSRFLTLISQEPNILDLITRNFIHTCHQVFEVIRTYMWSIQL